MNVKGKMPTKPMMKKGEHMMPGGMPMKNADMEKMRKEYMEKPAKKSGKK